VYGKLCGDGRKRGKGLGFRLGLIKRARTRILKKTVVSNNTPFGDPKRKSK